MITIYEIIDGLWTGGTREIGEADPVYDGWTRATPPALEPGGVARWEGSWVALTAEQWLAARKLAKLEALAARRWQAETGGIVLGGLAIKTDDDSQRKITGAYVKATRDAGFTVRWKLGVGEFISLDAPTILMIGDAVTEHIQSCFAKEDELTDLFLAAADHDELDAIDIGSDWPS